MPPRYRPAMRFHCCPPEKKGALATPKKGGTVGRSSGAGKGLRGSKGKAKSKNPMADVECEDEIEEEIQEEPMAQQPARMRRWHTTSILID